MRTGPPVSPPRASPARAWPCDHPNSYLAPGMASTLPPVVQAKSHGGPSIPHLRAIPAKSFDLMGAVAAVVAIAALYVHLFVFAELAFLNVVKAAVSGIKPAVVLISLGAGGIAGCVACAYSFHGRTGKWFATLGFVLSGVFSFGVLQVHSQSTVLLVALCVGAALGWTAVSVVLCLRPTVHGDRLGLVCGVGTGLALAICHLPFVLDAAPREQIGGAIVAVVFGAVATLRMRSEPYKLSGAVDFQRSTAAVWISVFTFLVLLDSAAFFVIEHTESLKLPSWDGSLVLYGNGFLHFCAALLTGIAIDRRYFTPALVAAGGLLVCACLILTGSPQLYSFAHVLYVGAASIYLTALVYYPARSGRRGLAATLFAVAGWGGSALGVALASKANGLPEWMIGIVAVLMTGVLILRKWTRGPAGFGVRF